MIKPSTKLKCELKFLPSKVNYALKPLNYGNGNHSLNWSNPPRNILLIKKSNNDLTLRALKDVINHIQLNYDNKNIIVEDKIKNELSGIKNLYTTDLNKEALLSSKIDLAITLGGDGTALHTASLFPSTPVPPVLSFSMGTLGFLLPFDISKYKNAINDVFNSNVSVIKRMRLMCTLHNSNGDIINNNHSHVLNEVAIHRGAFPHLVQIEVYVDGMLLTEAVADGLIVSTPTGSSAYSLSSGGPLVHPCLQSIILTPICPRSLSFRPVILPSDSTIQLKISSNARSAPYVSLDGRESTPLSHNNYIQISMSPFPLPSIMNPKKLITNNSSNLKQNLPNSNLNDNALHKFGRLQDDWVRDINDLLNFNSRFESKGREIFHSGHEDDDK